MNTESKQCTVRVAQVVSYMDAGRRVAAPPGIFTMREAEAGGYQLTRLGVLCNLRVIVGGSNDDHIDAHRSWTVLA